jgi:hypothetical protein
MQNNKCCQEHLAEAVWLMRLTVALSLRPCCTPGALRSLVSTVWSVMLIASDVSCDFVTAHIGCIVRQSGICAVQGGRLRVTGRARLVASHRHSTF